MDRKAIMKSLNVYRILMKIYWNIKENVPDSILEAPGADSGVKIEKNQKHEPIFFCKIFLEGFSPPYCLVHLYKYLHIYETPKITLGHGTLH